MLGPKVIDETNLAVLVDLPQVHFTGFLPPEALAERIRQSRVVVVPSRWYENFPYAVLEAQAAGRAVIASAIGGIPEQIHSGEDGWLVPPSDPRALAAAANQLLHDPTLAMRLGENARQRIAKTLQPEEHLRSILQTYRDVCGF